MIVVTGWPRSGTSLLMQILIAGGLHPIHKDGAAARTGNPGGVWEHPIAMHRPERLFAAHHRDELACIKVLYRPLQRIIGAGFPIGGVIYTDRDPAAALASQTEISAAGHRLDSLEGLALLKTTTVAGLDRFKIRHLEVPLRALIEDPVPVVAQIAALIDPCLPGPLDQAAMAAIPDPSLLHH